MKQNETGGVFSTHARDKKRISWDDVLLLFSLI
jgi:hypothetical protein